ncbi:DUF4870 domain-containing protein [Pontiellaceae bacterium B12227]|nr:DUF4870 domain-containing protein [Pontiellaceae bacterium B12227]
MENSEFKEADGIFEEVAPLRPAKNERQWAMACHLAAVAGYLMPFIAGNFLAPLVIWLIKREDGAFVDEQGKEALNFQLSLLLYSFICGLLFLVAIGAFLLFPLIVFGFVCPIIGAVKASEGRAYRYPMCIRFIK